MPKIAKVPTEAELYQRYAARCSTAEYAPADILQKAMRAGLDREAAERVVDRLIDENFINEERYIRAFVHDKFAFNHWGKTKIEFALRQKRLSGPAVRNELENIDEQQYHDTLVDLLKSKNRQLAVATNFERFKKLLAFAVSRGFETSLAYRIIEQEIGLSEGE